MMNGKFLRRVITKQMFYEPQITKALQRLFYNEYMFNKKDVDNEVELYKLKVQLPSPASLNQTNMIEQLGNANDLVEKISEILLETEETVEAAGFNHEALGRMLKKIN